MHMTRNRHGMNRGTRQPQRTQKSRRILVGEQAQDQVQRSIARKAAAQEIADRASRRWIVPAVEP